MAFHNPHDSETPKQIAYQRRVLTGDFGEEALEDSDQNNDNADQREPGPAGEGTRSRGVAPNDGNGSNDHNKRWSLKHLGEKLKSISQEIKPQVAMTKSFVTLESRIARDMQDASKFPETAYTARVRRSRDLCTEEKAFLKARKLRTRDAFERYLDLPPGSVDPDDVPTIAFGGSGGGYRAMLALLGYASAFRAAGLWDLLTYVAGVSGSCWAIGALYTFGECSSDRVIQHCRKRLSPHHPLSSDAIQAVLTQQPEGDYEALGPLIIKHKSGLTVVPMDLYSVFTTGYLFLQNPGEGGQGQDAVKDGSGDHSNSNANENQLRAQKGGPWWKWSCAQRFLQDGAEPMPLLTAIRHERPWKDWVDAEHPFTDADPDKEHKEATDAWFQWFEMNPYEVGCEELEAYCPTYAFGRPFSEGQSTVQLPEQSLALLLGLCTSAPAGPLSSYMATIERNLPGGFLGDTVKQLSAGVARIWGRGGTNVFNNHHPLHASNEHNFLFHYTPLPAAAAAAAPSSSSPPPPPPPPPQQQQHKKLKKKPKEENNNGTAEEANNARRPPGIENSPRIHLIDSGMDNNCPTMPLLNPARQVDVIINMDASSDVQKDSFPQRVQQIGSRRSMVFMKRVGSPGVGRVAAAASAATGGGVTANNNNDNPYLSIPPNTITASLSPADPDEDNSHLALPPPPPPATPATETPPTIATNTTAPDPAAAAAAADRFNGLYAQIYDGKPLPPNQPRDATVVDSYGQTVTNPPASAYTRDCTMVYLPLLPNDKVVPGFDPSTADFSGSYNLVWTAEQVDMLVKVAERNFLDGEATVKEALLGAWRRNVDRREGRGRRGSLVGVAY